MYTLDFLFGFAILQLHLLQQLVEKIGEPYIENKVYFVKALFLH